MTQTTTANSVMNSSLNRSELIYACAYAFQILAAINHEAHTVYIEDDWFLNHVTPTALNIRVKLKNILNNAHQIRAYVEPLNSLSSPLTRLDCYTGSQLELAIITMYKTHHRTFKHEAELKPSQAPAAYSTLILERLATIESYLIEALNTLKQTSHEAVVVIEEALDLSDLSHQLITLSEEIARIFPFLEASLIGYIQTKNGDYYYLESTFLGFSA